MPERKKFQDLEPRDEEEANEGSCSDCGCGESDGLMGFVERGSLRDEDDSCI